MSEGIMIALITAIGSLLGGIIGQSIAASATIKAAAIKEKLHLAPDNEGNKIRNFKGVLGGTLIGAFLTLAILVFLGVISFGGENAPTPTVTAEGKTTQSPAPSTSIPNTSNSSILFNEDFEDGKAQKMIYISGGWQIIADETGNKVYDIDNSKGSGFPGIDFGLESWKDYEIKFRVRFVEGAWAIVYFRSDGTTNGAYVASIDLTNTSLNYTTNGSNWKVMTNREYLLKKNTWYWVSIEANGAEIKVSINDSVVINTDDTLFNSGRITMQAGQYSHMQIDDIQVVPLEK